MRVWEISGVGLAVAVGVGVAVGIWVAITVWVGVSDSGFSVGVCTRVFVGIDVAS